jgi:ATP-dependent Lon protease
MRSEDDYGGDRPDDQDREEGQDKAADKATAKVADKTGGEAEGEAVADAPGVQVEDGRASVLVQANLPETMFVFPLRRAVPFPNLMMPLLLAAPEARDVVAKAEAHNGHLLLVMQKNQEQELPGEGDLHEIGVVTRILKTIKLPDGSMSSMTQGLRRARMVKIVRKKPHLVARVK